MSAPAKSPLHGNSSTRRRGGHHRAIDRHADHEVRQGLDPVECLPLLGQPDDEEERSRHDEDEDQRAAIAQDPANLQPHEREVESTP